MYIRGKFINLEIFRMKISVKSISNFTQHSDLCRERIIKCTTRYIRVFCPMRVEVDIVDTVDVSKNLNILSVLIENFCLR